MNDQVFSDGIGAITSVAGTVRLDLVSYSPTEKDAKGQPLLVFRQRIIMPAEAFLLAAEKIHEVARALGNRPATRPRDETPAPQAGPVLVEAAPAPAAPSPAAVPPARPFP